MFPGCLASISYWLFAVGVVGSMFPPHHVPGLSQDRGLDLRGMEQIFGSWIGGILGFVAAAATSLVSTVVRRRRKRRTSVPQQLPTA